MRIVLQKRDKDILKYLMKYKVATVYHIMAHLDYKCSRQRVVERLNQLIEKGFVKSTSFAFKKIYGIGSQGQL